MKDAVLLLQISRELDHEVCDARDTLTATLQIQIRSRVQVQIRSEGQPARLQSVQVQNT